MEKEKEKATPKSCNNCSYQDRSDYYNVCTCNICLDFDQWKFDGGKYASD